MIMIAIGVVGIIAFMLFDDQLINLFLHESEASAEINKDLTLAYGKEYLSIMLIGFIPYVISQAYASTMRETGSTIVPMVASVSAVLTNLVFNAILIFGYLGFPALGVAGAAIATVISRFVELIIVLVWSYTHTYRYVYFKRALRSFRIPKKLLLGISMKGLPIMANEFFWSLAMTLRNQTYSTRGLDVVAAMNIHTTLFNLFNVVYLSLGVAVSIIIGKLLGAGEIEKAKDTDRKMIFFSVVLSTGIMLIYIAMSFFYPSLYNTTDAVRSLARYMMIVAALIMPLLAFNNCAYFTIRAGGKALTTALFDAGFMWAIVMPICLVIAHFTTLNIFVMFAICQSLEIVKTVMGIVLLKRGNWAKQLVSDGELVN
jgi:putative MATE family efflux protein